MGRSGYRTSFPLVADLDRTRPRPRLPAGRPGRVFLSVDKSGSKQVKEVQKKIEVLMTDKEIKFKNGSWDTDLIAENKAILDGLAIILKENPSLAINVHGVMLGQEKSWQGTFKDRVTGKSFAECFPEDPDPFVTKRGDTLSFARATASVHALRRMGCKNDMSVSGEANGSEMKIVFSVKP